MDAELPTWLDKSFLTSVLQEIENNGSRITLTKFSAEKAVPPGNNFTSTIFRTRVEYKTNSEEKSTIIIIKTPITIGMAGDMLQNIDLFGKEPTVYSELLPILNELMKCQFGPKSFTSPTKNTLVMEDLKEKGYSLCDRFKQLNFSHCELVLKTLAKFHAGSVACRKNNPDLIEKVGKEVLYFDGSKFLEQMGPWVTGGLTIVSGIISQMGVGKDVEELFRNSIETAVESMIELCKPRATGLNVLNHGDLWNSNILFKHDDLGNVVDLRFIDYQACKYSSPVMDLIYFLWTSANENVRETHLPELCEIYRGALNSALKDLGREERLTKEDLHEQFRNAKVWVMVAISTILPVQMSEPEFHEAMTSGETSLQDIKDDGMKMFMKLYEGKQYKSLLPNLVKHIQVWMAYYK